MKSIIHKTTRKTKLKLSDAKFAMGLKKWKSGFPLFQRILLYHGVDEEGNTKINSRFIGKRKFEEHLIFFKKHFHIISLEDYFLEKFHPERPGICLTFDDGYANNLHVALPLLEKHEISATVFITTIKASGNNILWADVLDMAAYKYKAPFEIAGEKFILKRGKGYVSEKTKIPLKESIKNKTFEYKLRMQKAIPGLDKILDVKKLKTYWELLSPEQINELSMSKLITIGSHGYYHNCLDTLSDKEIEFELRESKAWLENSIKKPVKALAFPDGAFSAQVIKIAIEQGYSQLLSVFSKEKKNPESRNLKTRLVINPHISLNNQIEAIIKGHY